MTKDEDTGVTIIMSKGIDYNEIINNNPLL